MIVTDGALVLKTLEGDKSAFSRLYDRYAGLVRAICNDTTGNLEDAQDLAQEVFIRAFTKLNKLQNPDIFGAWITGMAKNVCREYRRGKFRDRHVLVGLAPEDKPAEKGGEHIEISLDLRDALARLSEKERLALHVYYLQEQDIAKACKILQVSRAGLFRLLKKARENLEKELGK